MYSSAMHENQTGETSRPLVPAFAQMATGEKDAMTRKEIYTRRRELGWPACMALPTKQAVAIDNAVEDCTIRYGLMRNLQGMVLRAEPDEGYNFDIVFFTAIDVFADDPDRSRCVYAVAFDPDTPLDGQYDFADHLAVECCAADSVALPTSFEVLEKALQHFDLKALQAAASHRLAARSVPRNQMRFEYEQALPTSHFCE